jgi:hypothetical protein
VHQHFTLDPLLDGLLVRYLIEVLVQIAELVEGKASIPGRLGWKVEGHFAFQLVNPDGGKKAELILMPSIEQQLFEDLVLDVFDEIYERKHNQSLLSFRIQVT